VVTLGLAQSLDAQGRVPKKPGALDAAWRMGDLTFERIALLTSVVAQHAHGIDDARAPGRTC